MIKHEEIQVPLCKLVNLILEQVKDRESTMSFPNEHLSEMLDIGKKIWEKQIDPHLSMMVHRSRLDKFLQDLNVTANASETVSFLQDITGCRIRSDQVSRS